jgi:hypothetical protein
VIKLTVTVVGSAGTIEPTIEPEAQPEAYLSYLLSLEYLEYLS